MFWMMWWWSNVWWVVMRPIMKILICFYIVLIFIVFFNCFHIHLFWHSLDIHLFQTMWWWSDVWWWVVVGPILKIFICPNLHSRREPGLVLRGAKIPLGRSSWSYFLPLLIPVLTDAQWHKCGICPHCLSCGSFQLETWKYWSLKWWKRFEKFPVHFLLVSCFD